MGELEPEDVAHATDERIELVLPSTDRRECAAAAQREHHPAAAVPVHR
jgi:hypothetical protein